MQTNTENSTVEVTVAAGLDATRLASRLTGNAPWETSGSYPIDNGMEAAKKQGLKVVPAQADELQIDIDNKESHERFYSMLGMLMSFFPDITWEEKKSKSESPFRLHITVNLGHKISNVERVLLQAIMGSDPKRELLSYIRLLRGIEPATLFFEKDEDAPPKSSIPVRAVNGGYF
jgi:hypothetical protein